MHVAQPALPARVMHAVAPLLALAVLAGVVPATGSAPPLARPVADADGRIAAAAAASAAGMRWYGLDGHLHTDHSHDAGIFHQADKKPENHDTFVADQLAEVERQGEAIATLTDHRTYDQAYDPAYRSDTMTLLDGEEWGGYPHATAWGITEVLEQGPDEGVCGVARAAGEVRAQDAIFGVAHPEDGRRSCIETDTLRGVPIDHLEAFRSPDTGFWARAVGEGLRLVPVTGSDNHFRQLYGTDGGPGASSTFVLARSTSQAAIVDAVRAGRVFSATRGRGPLLTTFLDADLDGSFDALTGGWAESGGGTVRVAFRVEGAPGHWLQVLDAASNIVAQQAVVSTDQTFAFDLPGTAGLYRGQLSIQPLDRISGPGYLAYEDTLRVLSAPVYLSAPAPVENGSQGSATALGAAPFSGFSDVAASGDRVHAVWQERRGARYVVAYALSEDAGTTWSAPRLISPAGEDARLPAVAADGDRVAIAYETKWRCPHDGGLEPNLCGRHDAAIRLEISSDGGASFASTLPHGASPRRLPLGARPDVAVAGGDVHLVWMSQEDGYKIRYQRFGDRATGSWELLSSAVAWNGGIAHPMSVPPRVIRHVPAALHPAVVARGDTVVVAWEDNREDPTPLRNGTPDDWGIYGAVSTDAGLTFGPDERWTTRHDRRPATPASIEALEGNPARHPSLLLRADGSLVLAFDDPFGSGGANVFVQRSMDLGATWSAAVMVDGPTAELETRPQLREAGGDLEVVFQRSAGRAWALHVARSSDGGITFGPSGHLMTATGFQGFPSVAGDVVAYTGEAAGAYRVFVTR